MNDYEGYLCKYPEGDKKQDIVCIILLFSVTYDGKAPMFLLCVGAIHLTSCVKIQKNYSMKISEREACRNKNTN